MILFFYGQNSYALRQEVQRLVAAYVKKTGSDFGLERIDGARAPASSLMATLQTVPFLASSRLVIIEDLGQNKAATADLERLLEHIPSSTVAVFSDPGADRRSRYFKTLSEAGRPMEFKPLTASQLAAWIRQEAGRQGATIGPQATRRLVELAGEDQWRLAGEIGKLANRSSDIGVKEVNEMVEAGFNETVFSLVDAMTSGHANTALTLYRGLLGQKSSEIYILTMIQWQLRNLLTAKAGAGISPTELSKRAGMSPYVASKVVARQAAFSLETLKMAFSAAVECEFQIKTGEQPAEAAVEQLIFKVASQSAAKS